MAYLDHNENYLTQIKGVICMIEVPNHPSVHILQSFFNEMNKWETAAYKYEDSIDWPNANEDEVHRTYALQREERDQIYEKYCEVGRGAKRLRDKGASFSKPPEHEGEIIISLKEKAGKVIVVTRQSNPKGWEFRYELVQVDDQWRICDNRKRRFPGDEKWKVDLL